MLASGLRPRSSPADDRAPSRAHALLTPEQLLAAAERILANPTCNVQRVAMDEIYTFAIATTQFAEVAALAVLHLQGTASPEAIEHLRAHLHALGTLPPGNRLPNHETQENPDG